MPLWQCFASCLKENATKRDDAEQQHVAFHPNPWVPELQTAQRSILALDGHWLARLRNAAAAIGSSLGATVVRVYGANPNSTSYIWLAEAKRQLGDPPAVAPPQHAHAASAPSGAPRLGSPRPSHARASAESRAMAAGAAAAGAGAGASAPLVPELEPPALPLLILDALHMHALACGEGSEELLARFQSAAVSGNDDGSAAAAAAGAGPSGLSGGGTAGAAPPDAGSEPAGAGRRQSAAAAVRPAPPHPYPHPHPQQQRAVAAGAAPAPYAAAAAAVGAPDSADSALRRWSNASGGMTMFALIVKAGCVRVGAIVVEGGPTMLGLAAAAAAANTASMLYLPLPLLSTAGVNSSVVEPSSAAVAGGPGTDSGSHEAACPSVAFTMATIDAGAVSALQQLAAAVGQVCWGSHVDVIGQACAGVEAVASMQVLAQVASHVGSCVEAAANAACRMQPLCSVAMVHGSGLAAAVLEDICKSAVGAAPLAPHPPLLSAHTHTHTLGTHGTNVTRTSSTVLGVAAGMGTGNGAGGGGGTGGGGGVLMLGNSRSQSVHMSREDGAAAYPAAGYGVRRGRGLQLDPGNSGTDYRQYTSGSFERLPYDHASTPVVAHVLTTQNTLLERVVSRVFAASSKAAATAAASGAGAGAGAGAGTLSASVILGRAHPQPAPTQQLQAPSPALAVTSGLGRTRSGHLRAVLRSAAAATAAAPSGPVKASAPSMSSVSISVSLNNFSADPQAAPQEETRAAGAAADGRVVGPTHAARPSPATVATATMVVPDVSKHVQDPAHGSKDLLLWQSRAGNRTMSTALLACCFRPEQRRVQGAAAAAAAVAGAPAGAQEGVAVAAAAAGGGGAGAGSEAVSAGAMGFGALTVGVYLHFWNGPLPVAFLQHVVEALEPVVQLLTPVLLQRLSAPASPLAEEWSALHDTVLSDILVREGLLPPAAAAAATAAAARPQQPQQPSGGGGGGASVRRLRDPPVVVFPGALSAFNTAPTPAPASAAAARAPAVVVYPGGQAAPSGTSVTSAAGRAQGQGSPASLGGDDVGGSGMRRCPSEPAARTTSYNDRLLSSLHPRRLATTPLAPGTAPGMSSSSAAAASAASYGAAAGGLGSAGHLAAPSQGSGWGFHGSGAPGTGTGTGMALAGALQLAALGGGSVGAGELSVGVNYVRGNYLRPLLTSVHGALASVFSSGQHNTIGSDAAMIAAAAAAAAHTSEVLTATLAAPLAELSVKVGQGAFGCVYMGCWQGVSVAIKVLPSLTRQVLPSLAATPTPTRTPHPAAAALRPHGAAAAMAAVVVPAAHGTLSDPASGPVTASATQTSHTTASNGLVDAPTATTLTSVGTAAAAANLSSPSPRPASVHAAHNGSGGANAGLPGGGGGGGLRSLPPGPALAVAGGGGEQSEQAMSAARWQSVRDAFELAALRVVSHPNIVQVFATYPDVLLQPLDDTPGGAELPAVLVAHPTDVAATAMSAAIKRWAAGGAMAGPTGGGGAGARGSRPQLEDGATAAAGAAAGVGHGGAEDAAAAAAAGQGQMLEGVGEPDESLLYSTLLSAGQSQADPPSGGSGTSVTAIVMELCDAGSLADLLRQGGIRRMMLAREHAAALAAMSSAATTMTPMPSLAGTPTVAAAAAAVGPQPPSGGTPLPHGGGGGGGGGGPGMSATVVRPPAAMRPTAVQPSHLSTAGGVPASATCTTSWGSAFVYDVNMRPSPTASGKLYGHTGASDSTAAAAIGASMTTGGMAAASGGAAAVLATTSISSKVPPRSHSMLSQNDQGQMASDPNLLIGSHQSSHSPQSQTSPPPAAPAAAVAAAPHAASAASAVGQQQHPRISASQPRTTLRSHPHPHLLSYPHPHPHQQLQQHQQPQLQTEERPPPAAVPVRVRPTAESCPRRASVSLTTSQPLLMLNMGGSDAGGIPSPFVAPVPEETSNSGDPPPGLAPGTAAGVQESTASAAGAGGPLPQPPQPPRRSSDVAASRDVLASPGGGHGPERSLSPSPSASSLPSPSPPLTRSAQQQQQQHPQHTQQAPQPGHLALHAQQHPQLTPHLAAAPPWQRRASLLAGGSYAHHALPPSLGAGMGLGLGGFAAGLLSPPGAHLSGVAGATAGGGVPSAPVLATPRTFEALRQFLAGSGGAVGAGAGGRGGGGALSEADRLDFRPVMLIVLELASALRHLHSHRLVHCDVKPSNVLLKSSTTDPRGWVCKLSDFGCVRLLRYDDSSAAHPDAAAGASQPAALATITAAHGGAPYHHSLMSSPHNSGETEGHMRGLMSAGPGGGGGGGVAVSSRPSHNGGGGSGLGGAAAVPAFDGSQFVGSVQYMAPELLRRERRCTAAVDMYSLGVLMWELVSDGAQPYAGLTRRLPASLVEGICAGLRPAFGDSVPDWYRRLVESCWSGNPAERPSAAEVVSIARRWLEGGAPGAAGAQAASASAGSREPLLRVS